MVISKEEVCQALPLLLYIKKTLRRILLADSFLRNIKGLLEKFSIYENKL